MEVNSLKKSINPYSFRAAYQKVPKGKAKEVREKIMDSLNVFTYPAFHSRMHGQIIPKMHDAEKLEKIFASYGVELKWGEDPEAS